MKKKDLLLILAALLIGGALFAVSQLGAGKNAGSAAVVIRLDGKEMLRKPLVLSGEYEMEQEDGARNVIAVERGEVYMKEANCRDGLCMGMGRMRSSAKTIVCLPHKLTVTIEGSAPLQNVEDDLDVIIQ